jgi:hypothetical protein
MFRPWLFVISAFLLLLAAWSSLIFVATKFAPEPIIVNVGHKR